MTDLKEFQRFEQSLLWQSYLNDKNILLSSKVGQPSILSLSSNSISSPLAPKAHLDALRCIFTNLLKNSLKIRKENKKENHNRVVSLYVIKTRFFFFKFLGFGNKNFQTFFAN